MYLINIVFGVFSVACLIFSLAKLFFIISSYKQYESVMVEVLKFKNEGNSENFARANLMNKGFKKVIIDDVLDEYYS